MRRKIPAVLLCCTGLAIAGLVACDNQPSRSPGLPTPTSPGPGIVRIEVGGPVSVAPGATAQLTAIAHLADGSSRDITADASWGSSNQKVLSVSNGRVSGHAIGEAIVSANFTSARSTREVIVVPPDTFRLVGLVTEIEPPSSPIVDATVVAAGGAGDGLSTTTGEDGRYRLYGVAGDLELRITKDGYEPYTQQYRAADHAILNAQMRLRSPRRDLSGTYTLTIAAGDDCRLDLSQELRTRNYTASVVVTGNVLDVRLEGPTFAVSKTGHGNIFRGRVEPTGIVFSLSKYEPYSYFYYHVLYGDLVEQLTESSYLVVSGLGRGTESGSGFGGTLHGALTVLSGALTYFPKTEIECRSTNHRFTFVRR